MIAYASFPEVVIVVVMLVLATALMGWAVAR